MNITQYECQACGWIYPPQSDNQSKQVAQFTELTDSFSCPLCGVGKSEFCPVNEANQQGESDAESIQSNRQQIIIIGAGLAGWSVVDAIRALNKEVVITLIAADNADRYHKPMLSAAFSQKKSAKDLIRFTGEEAANKADIKLLANSKVLAIDSDNRKVLLDNSELSYDKLVMAIGAAPAIPPSIDAQNVWHINNIGSFNDIEQALSSSSAPKHIAIIGAGMVGTEVAEDLTKAGHKVSLLDMNKAPLALMLPEIASSKIKQAIIDQGINFIGNSRVDSVSSLSDGGYQLTVIDCGDSSQQTVEVDHILVSTGLKVEETLPQSAKLDFDRLCGISVQEATLQSSDPDIYAIGDCMSISGAPCRYVAPLRAQASTIAEHLLAHLEQHPAQADQAYEHKAYVHKPPMIRLKNKSISVSATGTPTADEQYGKWQVVSDTETEVGQELVLQQVAADATVVATATVKSANK